MTVVLCVDEEQNNYYIATYVLGAGLSVTLLLLLIMGAVLVYCWRKYRYPERDRNNGERRQLFQRNA